MIINMIDLSVGNIYPEKMTVTAVGFFDGLHKGHKSVVKRAIHLAAEKGFSPAVFTFGKNTIPSKEEMIVSAERKKSVFAGIGIRYVYSPDFDLIKNLSPREFVQDILRGKMNASHVVCGEDFRFGKNASGNVRMLEELCLENNMGITVVPDITDGAGLRISSTGIRGLIRGGEIKKANSLLGYAFTIGGTVITGNRIGRRIDFPTVNINYPEGMVVPKFGVYASAVFWGGESYAGVTNIGVKPTVQEGGGITAETHIFDFNDDIYGRNIMLRLGEFIREEKKFTDISELSVQIESDVALAREYAHSWRKQDYEN